MKFSKKFIIKRRDEIPVFAKGIWSPTIKDWSEIVEDYIYLSRKRMDNKMSMLRLQLSILMDIVNFVKWNDQIKIQTKEWEEEKKKEGVDVAEIEKRIEDVNSDLRANDLIQTALKEVMDGVVWRYFKYNRAILHILADKQSSGLVRPDQGLINTMFELAHVFTNPKEIAILNDITNFLKVGDITTIKPDGTIELLEIKSGNKSGRGRRITRQKERMEEIVEFFNTGISERDGKKAKIAISPVKQKNYLSLFLEGINVAKTKGFYSQMIGGHMIVEYIYPRKVEDWDVAIESFKNRHVRIKDEWKRKQDFVVPHSAIEKLEFSKNFAPFTIFPFPDEVCADLLCGRVLVLMTMNYSEVMRLFQKSGWEIVDSIFSKTPDEIEGMDASKIFFMTVSKEGGDIGLPPAMVGRLAYEFMSPRTLIDECERIHAEGSPEDVELRLTSYIDDERIWN